MSWQILPIDRGDLAMGLQARLADPLWMLHRQGMVGELTGESAGSPAQVEVEVESVPLGDGPLEPAIEAESVLEDPVQRVRISAEAGRVLWRDAARVRRRRWVAAHPLIPPPDASAREALRIRVWARASFDALAALDAGFLTRAEQRTLGAWLDATYGIPSVGSWRPTALAYDAEVSVGNGNVEVRSYPGGRLSWPDLTVTDRPSRGRRQRSTVLPARVRFPGIADRRFWSAEDSEVNFGELDVEADRISQLIVSEFAVIYADDWFNVPVRVDRGQLVRVRSLVVRDSFGATSTVADYRTVDADRSERWALWQLEGAADWLAVPAPLSPPLQGPPIERVTLWRDELANRGEAAEQRIATPTGGSRPPSSEPAPSSSSAGWVYTLRPAVPSGFIPLIVAPREDSAQIDLQVGRYDGGGEAQTALLTELAGQRLPEERLQRIHTFQGSTATTATG